MAAAASNAHEDRLLDALSPERQLLLCCCCCGQAVHDPILLRCLHGCCSSCASQLLKKEAGQEKEATGGRPTSASDVRTAGALPMPPLQGSLVGQSALTSADLGGLVVKPEQESLCRSCGEPLLLAAGGAKRRNYFLASMLHSLHAEQQSHGRQLVPPPQQPCDTCKLQDDGSAVAAASRHRCDECCLNLCDRCVKWHEVFRPTHRTSVGPLSPSHRELTPAPACSAHGGRPCAAVCLTCTHVACDNCAQACRDRKHDVRDATVDDRRRATDADIVEAASARRKDVLSNRTSLCDQQSLLVERQKEASRRRAAGAREACEALTARRRSLLGAVDRAHDALAECCRYQGALPGQQASAGRSDAAAEPPACREAAALDRSVRHLLAYSEEFASHADDIVLLEQHDIVTARLTMLKKVLEAATTAADSACKEGSEEERRLRELARAAPPAGEDEVLEVVARLCLLGWAQQLPEMLMNNFGSARSGDRSSGDGIARGGSSSSNSSGGGITRDGSSGSSGGSSGSAVDRRATAHRASVATSSADGASVVQPCSQSQQSLPRPEHRHTGEVASRTLPPAAHAAAEAAADRPIAAGAAGLITGDEWNAGSLSKLSASSAARSAAAVDAIGDVGRGIAASRPPWSPYSPMRLGYPRSRFRTKTPCHGLTFTADGNLLIAAGEEGLLEFTPDGPQVGGWRPPQQGDYVAGAATLGDGRVAVILRDSQSLMLLRRKRRVSAVDGSSSDSWMQGHSDDSHRRNLSRGIRWTLDRQVPLPLFGCCVAAYGMIVATVGGPSSRRLRVVSLVDGDRKDYGVLLMDRELDCGVLALALTERLMVLLCELPQQQAADVTMGSVDRPCTVQCRGHGGGKGDCSGGHLLWSTVCDHWASDVCASPCGQIVYLALPYAETVLALAVSDGSSLTAIRATADGWTLRRPSWLAVWRGARRGAGAADDGSGNYTSTMASHGESAAVAASAAAAMLSTDLHSVSVFPVIA